MLTGRIEQGARHHPQALTGLFVHQPSQSSSPEPVSPSKFSFPFVPQSECPKAGGGDESCSRRHGLVLTGWVGSGQKIEESHVQLFLGGGYNVGGGEEETTASSNAPGGILRGCGLEPR